MPDLIYGSELSPEKRKPSDYPIKDIMHRLGVDPLDVVVVDDLTLGYEMADCCKVDFVAACWAHSIP